MKKCPEVHQPVQSGQIIGIVNETWHNNLVTIHYYDENTKRKEVKVINFNRLKSISKQQLLDYYKDNEYFLNYLRESFNIHERKT